MSTIQTEADLQTRLNIRVGKKFKERYNKYLEDREMSGASFSRDAIEYWMSVDGNPENLQQQVIDLDKENQHLRELLAEKERTISILQDQIQRLDGTRPSPLLQVNGNKNHTSAVVTDTSRKSDSRE